jgi:hypothetical protein
VLVLFGVSVCRLSSFLLATFLLSLLIFLLNVVLLHRLSLRVLRQPQLPQQQQEFHPLFRHVDVLDSSSDSSHNSGATSGQRLAFLSAVCFICSPAAIFHAACYSEGVFALLAFSGMYLRTVTSNSGSCNGHGDGGGAASPWRLLLAALCFAAAGTVRANGWILAGFFVFDALRSTAQHVLRGHRDGSNPSPQQQQPDQYPSPPPPPPMHPALAWLLCGVLCCITVAPFVLQQYHLAAQFCSSPLAADPKPAYCTSSSLLPSVYAHVQRKYWFVFQLNHCTPLHGAVAADRSRLV